MTKSNIVHVLQEALGEHHLVVSAPENGEHTVKHVHGDLSRFLKVGDKVKSSDLDDFQNEGFKVREDK